MAEPRATGVGDAPVCLLVYRRPELTRRVFAAVRAARPRTLLVVADGPRPGDEAEARLCEKTRAIVRDVDWECEVLTEFAPENMGLRARVSSGLTWVFSQVEEAVILEDDCLPDPSFFPYCAELLDRYRHDERVMLVSGDNAHGFRPRDASYYFTRYALIWGWATWRRAWARYDDAMTDWPARRDAGWVEQAFPDPRAAAQWKAKFADGHARFNSWARAWVYACFTSGGLCAAPGRNLVSNIGFGAEATHTRGLVDGRSAVDTRPLEFPLRHPGRVAADPAADRFIERRLFSGAAVPASCDAADLGAALAAWKGGDPWAALRGVEAASDRLRDSAPLALARAGLLGRLGLWDQAAASLDGIAPEEASAPRLAPVVARARARVARGRERAAGRTRPGRNERLQLMRRLGLRAAPGVFLRKLGGDGRGYGAWVVADVLGPDSVCYLAGAGEDLTFDCALAARYGCAVEVFDPTPRSVAHFEGLRAWAAAGGRADDPVFGKYAGTSPEAVARLRYHALGLFERSAVMRFFAPRKAEHVSHSILNLQGTEDYFEAECLSLPDAMRRLGHRRIDLLKLDIEGSEYGVAESVAALGLDVGMVCIEFDEGYNPLDPDYLERMTACAETLRGAGFVPVCLDDWNATFLRRAGAGFLARAREALAALNGPQPGLALSLLESLWRERPGAAGPLYGLGLAQARSGRKDAATKTLDALLERFPGHAPARTLREGLAQDARNRT